MQINVTKTHIPDRTKLYGYFDSILDSAWLTNNGLKVQELTSRLESYLGVKNLVLVSNGTLALQIAYKALGICNEVITTPFSFAATVSSLKWQNINPIFCDIDSKTFNINTNNLEQLITESIKAIVPVHVFGNSCDIDKIDKISKKYNLKVVYDAAHCFNVKYNGQSILNYGDISCISFHSTKLFHTIEGGALIIKDDYIYEKVKKIISFGFDWTDNGKICEVGINAKMNEFQAAMGLCVLDEIDESISTRKKYYEYYKSALTDIFEFQQIDANCDYNYSYCPVLFKNEKDLLIAVDKLNKIDISPRRYFFPSLDTIPFYINMNSNTCQNSQNIASRILCLPLYKDLTFNDLDLIIKTLKQG